MARTNEEFTVTEARKIMLVESKQFCDILELQEDRKKKGELAKKCQLMKQRENKTFPREGLPNSLIWHNGTYKLNTNIFHKAKNYYYSTYVRHKTFLVRQ